MLIAGLLVITISFLTVFIGVYYVNTRISSAEQDIDKIENDINNHNQDINKTWSNDEKLKDKLIFSENQMLDRINKVKTDVISLINSETKQRLALEQKTNILSQKTSVVEESTSSLQQSIRNIINTLTKQEQTILAHDIKFMKQIDDLRRENEKYNVQSEDMFRKISSQMEKTIQDVNGLNSSINSKMNATDLTQYNQTLSTLSNNFNSYTSSNDNRFISFSTSVTSSFSNINNRITQLQTVPPGLPNDVDQLKSWRTVTEQTLGELTNTRNGLTSNVNNLNTWRTITNQTVQNLSTNMNNLNSWRISTDSNVSGLNNILSNIPWRSIQDSQNSMNSTVTNLASWRPTVDSRIGVLQQQTSELTQFRDRTTNDIAAVQTNVTQIGTNYSTLEQQQNTLMNMIRTSSNNSNMTNAVNAVNKLQSDLANEVKTMKVNTADIDLTGTMNVNGRGVVMNDKPLLLRSATDNTNGLQFEGNGPRLWGTSGGKLGTGNGRNALVWTADGNTQVLGRLSAETDVTSATLNTRNLTGIQGDWLRIRGSTTGIAMHNGVAVNEGGLAVGSWDKAPQGELRISNGNRTTTQFNVNNSGANIIKGDTSVDNVKVNNPGCMELGVGKANKAPEEGNLCFQRWSDSVDIVGAGNHPNRKVRVWDQLQAETSVTTNTLNTKNINADNVDWLRIHGSAANGIAMYNGVAVNDGGLSVGAWEKPPKGELRITNGNNSKTHFNINNTSVNHIRGNTFADEVKINNKGCIELGAGTAGKHPDSGAMCYQKWTDAVDLVGAGNFPNRKVRIHDELHTNNVYASQGIVANTGLGVAGTFSVNNVASTLHDKPLRLRNLGDANHSLVYDKVFDGPRLTGFGGGALGTANGQNALTWESNRRVNIQGEIRQARRDRQFTHFDWEGDGRNYLRGETLHQGMNRESDQRLKKDIKDISNTDIENLSKLKPKEYKKKNTNTPEYGFLAQDVEKVYPDLVTNDKDGFKALRYESITPLLVGKVNDMSKQVNTEKLCIGDVCLTQEDVKKLKNLKNP